MSYLAFLCLDYLSICQAVKENDVLTRNREGREMFGTVRLTANPSRLCASAVKTKPGRHLDQKEITIIID